MNKKEYHDLFDLGIKLRDDGLAKKKAGDTEGSHAEFLKAIKLLEEIYSFEFHPDKFNKSLILGGLYNWTENKRRAFEMFSIAVNLNLYSETASLCLYLIYVDLNQSENALKELERYLTSNSANLYKDTLLELLEEVENGRFPIYKEKILFFAQRNGVSTK